MNILRNFIKYRQGIVIGSIGQIVSFVEIFSKDTKIIGRYAELSKKIIGLFKSSDSELSILIDNEIYTADNNLEVNFRIENEHSQLSVIYYKSTILNIEYKTPEPMSTLWYTEDTDDADFGEWIFNILNSDLRKSILIENNEKFE